MTETTERPEHGINVPAMRKMLEHITAHPEEWDQGNWAAIRTAENITVQAGKFRCGTTACAAGTVVLQAGYVIDWESEYAEHAKAKVAASTVVGGESIPDVAAGVLGLDEDQAQRMFYNFTRDPCVMWRLAAEFTNDEITVPADLPGGAA